MYPNLILYIVAFCAVNSWMAVAQDERVDQMNALLKNAGWLLMNRQDIDDGERYSVNDLLAPSSNGEVVTSENVDDKIRKVYKLVVCNYGRMLMNFNDNVTQLGKQCLRNIDPSKALNCLNSYFLTFQESQSMLAVLGSVLTYFHRLSPQTRVEREFYNKLLFLRSYFDRKRLTKLLLIDENGIIDLVSIRAEFLAIQKFLTVFDSFLRLVIIKNCWPKPSPEQRQNNAVCTDLIKNMSCPAVAAPQQAFNVINKNLNLIIAQIHNNYYRRLGFIYDRHLKATKVKRDEF